MACAYLKLMTTGFSFAGTALAGLSNALGGSADLSAGTTGGFSSLSGLFSGLVDANGISTPTSSTGGDFFASLATAEASTAPVPDLSTMLAGLQTGNASDPMAQLQALLQNAGVQFTDSTNTATTPSPNPAAPLQILAQSLQQVQQVVAQLGLSMQDVAQSVNLKAVLQKLGVPTDKIDSLTATIQSALDKTKDILGADDTQTSALAQLMVAINVAPYLKGNDGQPLVTADQPINFVLTAAPAADTSTSQSIVARAQNALQQATSYSTAADVAREVAGLKTTDGKKVKTSDSIDDTTPQVAAPLPDTALPAVAVVIDAAGASVKPAVKTPLSSGNNIASTANVQTIDNSQVLAPVTGDVKFTWNGEDTAQPVATATDKSVTDDIKIETKPDLTLSTQTTRAELLAQTAPQGGSTISAANAAQQADFAQQVEQFQQKLDLAKRYDVTNQTVVQMKSLVDQGGGEIRIKLNPPELGQVHVELTVKDGAVSGKISASDPAVVNALAGDIKQFGDGLKQAGFKLGQDGLSFMLNQQNPQQQQQSQQQQQAQNNGGGLLGGGDALADDEVAQAANPAAWVAPDRLLDVNI
jgi:flagellar hook-length control protein FliK